MSDRPLVSIITATHNALDDLKKTAASIQAQSFRDFEHIVVDGDSTDGTRNWLATRSDIRWLSEPDSGIADALNKGLELATGKWVLVLQAADTFHDGDSLLDAATLLTDSSVDIVSFDVEVVTREGTVVFPTRGFSPRVNLKTTTPHQGAFCRRSLFDRIGRFDTDFLIGMDYEFFLRAYRAGAKATVGDRPLARMPDTGISSRADWVSLGERFREERAIHMKHARHAGMRLFYTIYWPAYLAYRRFRYLVEGNRMDSA